MFYYTDAIPSRIKRDQAPKSESGSTSKSCPIGLIRLTTIGGLHPLSKQLRVDARTVLLPPLFSLWRRPDPLVQLDALASVRFRLRVREQHAHVLAVGLCGALQRVEHDVERGVGRAWEGVVGAGGAGDASGFGRRGWGRRGDDEFAAHPDAWFLALFPFHNTRFFLLMFRYVSYE